MNEEAARLEQARAERQPWKKWGPYLSERQWGTVREDYSETGSAWEYVTHDQARSRAYAWGEDGIAGISDEQQLLCFAVALWNETDPILKERLFGLTNSEGNHGEDVKEYYFYLDSTPTHSYMKYLYKYPQAAFPYADLVETSRQRSRSEPEYELIDTGVFDDDRYFDVFVEYAKETAEDILIQISVVNRGAQPAVLHVLPTLWFRNTWSWSPEQPAPEPVMKANGAHVISASHTDLGEWNLVCDEAVRLLFTGNDTNNERIFGKPNRSPYVKDGINNYIVNDQQDAINPAQTGTKAAAHYQLTIAAGQTHVIRLRLSQKVGSVKAVFGDQFDETLRQRREEADEFYDSVTPRSLNQDQRLVMRQALAGMLWSKQFYYYDIGGWLKGTDEFPRIPNPKGRNRQWTHMVNQDIISMPDKWEYPWYAAWDLAFHTIALGIVDLDFAKQQLDLMLSENYMHPNGQLPAYEWNFGDVNPPVHAWAALFLYWNEKQLRGEADTKFLKRTFQKLLMNFTWWVNRKDVQSKNVFEGGFLGLDNIGVFDRSSPLPTGGNLEQADGTAWMAFYCQMMLQIALELAVDDDVYEELACKFYEHFLWIVSAMDRVGDNEDELWDEQDGFFYDLLRFPDGSATRLKVRSLVGLLSLCASIVVEREMLENLPKFLKRVQWFNSHRSELTVNIRNLTNPGQQNRYMLAILNEDKLRRVLTRMLNEDEFLSQYGIRSLSRDHADNPYLFQFGGETYRVDYEPAESSTGLFGGNSNWRGPIWFPINILIVRALIVMYSYYGDQFTIECPTGSGNQMNLWEVSKVIAERLDSIFLRDSEGKRPVFGGAEKFQNDPHWRDYILFYEYFHGDNGAGVGASHQTGWTGLVAKLLQLYGTMSGEDLLERAVQAAAAFHPETPDTAADAQASPT